MDLLDLLFKLSISGIVVGLSLITIGILLSYYDITGVVSIVGCFTVVINALLFAIAFLIEYWGYY